MRGKNHVNILFKVLLSNLDFHFLFVSFSFIVFTSFFAFFCSFFLLFCLLSRFFLNHFLLFLLNLLLGILIGIEFVQILDSGDLLWEITHLNTERSYLLNIKFLAQYDVSFEEWWCLKLLFSLFGYISKFDHDISDFLLEK